MHDTTRFTNCGNLLFSGVLNCVHCTEYEPTQRSSTDQSVSYGKSVGWVPIQGARLTLPVTDF